MPKLKTHKGAAKRFKKTGTGKVKRNKAFLRHILTSKDKKRKRQLGGATLVVCPCHVLYGAAVLGAGALGYALPARPELADGIHALYLVGAALGVAAWLRRGERSDDAGEGADAAPSVATGVGRK